MNTRNDSPSRRRSFVVASAIALIVAVAAAEGPSPRPTPGPGTLAGYAIGRTLKAPAAIDESGAIVITTTTLAEIAQRGTLTTGAVQAQRAIRVDEPSPKDRAAWRRRYFEQRRVVAALEQKRARVATQLDQLESGRLTAAIMARIDRAETELRLLDRGIRNEKLELARIVRDARRHGAEPGWFR
jgi:hypothetical protein